MAHDGLKGKSRGNAGGLKKATNNSYERQTAIGVVAKLDWSILPIYPCYNFIQHASVWTGTGSSLCVCRDKWFHAYE
jgi:hypothetical protein